MKQYRINSSNMVAQSEDDCYLAPDDPGQLFITHSVMGGLGARDRLSQYMEKTPQPNVGSNKGEIQRQNNIKPGTEEWFKLWFGKST